jgi:2-(1,2-epoxy-1,2-dihydrophenyl)acetyl-CoA isomerase
MGSGPLVDLRWEEKIAVITLNRPETLNALNQPLADELHRCLNRLRLSYAQAVILNAAGRVFSAGGDIREMKAAAAGDDPVGRLFKPLVRRLHECILLIRDLPVPVIAAVNGAAAGGACNLALACDFVIAGETAVFNEAFVRIGLTPDCGGTFILPRLIGWRRATELLMTGDFVDAKTAAKEGLITSVVPDAELQTAALRLARKLTNGPTAAIARIKRLLNQSAANDYAMQLEAEYQTQLESAETKDFVEGVTAFLEKRPPEFSGE